jgi:uncharacterized membrane protein
MKELRQQHTRFLPEEKTASEDRLVMLCDGIFSIAITLLVIGIGITPRSNSTQDVTEALTQLITPGIFYLVTFLIIAIFWRFHRNLMQVVQHLDNGFISLTFCFLAFIVFFPVISKLLGNYGDVPGVIILYTLSLSGCSFFAFMLWVYATWHHRLVSPDLSQELIRSQSIALLLNPLIYCASLLLLFFFQNRPYLICFSWVLVGFTHRGMQKLLTLVKKYQAVPQVPQPHQASLRSQSRSETPATPSEQRPQPAEDASSRHTMQASSPE